eukprot:UN02700
MTSIQHKQSPHLHAYCIAYFLTSRLSFLFPHTHIILIRPQTNQQHTCFISFLIIHVNVIICTHPPLSPLSSPSIPLPPMMSHFITSHNNIPYPVDNKGSTNQTTLHTFKQKYCRE